MKKFAVLFFVFLSGIVSTLFAEEPKIDYNIKKLFDQNDVKYSITSGCDFNLPFTDGNNVIVNSNLSNYKDLTVREIWVVFGDVGKQGNDLMYRMLTANYKMKIGAYSLASYDDKVYAIYTVRLPANASWKELWSAILFCSDIKLPEE